MIMKDLSFMKKGALALFALAFSFFIVSSVGAQSAPATDASAPATAAAAPATAAAPAAPAISAGDTAWVLASAALVMLMTPGLAFFYGGMVRKKNVMATIMQSFFILCLVSVQWVIFGYSIAFGPGNNWFGGLSWVMLNNMPAVSSLAPTIPHYAYMIFQAMFAVITPALITGGYAERVKFIGFAVFSLLWATFVYDPIAHMVWGGGYFANLGALDFAGGTVVHMSSGYSALALALLLGTRKGYGKESMVPHNLTLVLLGASLLWFGWFGFNAGSACAANALAANAFVTTNTATAMGAIVWNLIELLHKGKASSLGAASGAVAGLVAITPACGFVDLVGSFWVGGVVSIVCYLAIQVKIKLGYDDTLDTFGVHGVGGTWGAIATGIFATDSVNSYKGWLHGNPGQMIIQFKTVGVVAVYSMLATTILYFLVEKTIGLKATPKEEELGLDLSQHGEEGYIL
jgi:ammonium transporter, Amt family